MGNAPSVSVDATLASNVPPVPYLNHALITFAAEDATFNTNFATVDQPWIFKHPNTLLGTVAEVSGDNWQSRLKALGAPTTEPIWIALAAYWNPLGQPDEGGNRERVTKSDVIYIGRRTSAVVSANTLTLTSNAAGRIRVKINPARFLYSASGPPAGSLADVTVIAAGVKTIADPVDEIAAALPALPDFAAHFAGVSDGVNTVEVESLRPGYPLVMVVMSSTPGPAFTQAITTANVANAYRDDLIEMQGAAEFGSLLDVPSRKYYWITDLQGDDVVNNEGMLFAQNQGDSSQFTPIRDYRFRAWSTSGDRRITIGANFVGNFDPLSTASAAGLASVANGGAGYTRAGVHDHDRLEFLVPALLGRCIGYLPGKIAFTARVLQGGVDAAKMSPRDFGDNETLTEDRHFDWYSAEGPGLEGSHKWGYQADGTWVDNGWTEDYIRYQVRVDLLAWMQLKNIVTYTDVDIKAGEGIIAAAIAKIPAVIPSSIGVVSLSRDQVNPANIVARIYLDYVGNGDAGGVINKMGTPSNPLPITIQIA